MYLENLQILGFKANIHSVSDTLNEIDVIKQEDEIIQFLDADAIVSKNHIVHGVNQAVLAFQRGENLANDIGVEVVLRCSAQRQISKAFNILGLKEGKMNLIAVLINCRDYSSELSSMFISESDDVFLNDVKKLKEIYNINDFEDENMSLENILIDRITKLTVDY